tara:strand:+ start:1325 stop:1501 length:177 start_codon:yes stop_codon:yes gene_type:complete
MSTVDIALTERFCILSAYNQDHKDLVEKIDDMLKKGWALSGGLTASNSKLYQALIKNE